VKKLVIIHRKPFNISLYAPSTFSKITPKAILVKLFFCYAVPKAAVSGEISSAKRILPVFSSKLKLKVNKLDI
jgi:hypothetical protein